ncbi:peptidoglycan-binding protein [Scytonema hofmannii PCC 7110]|uniref:Peptidoglycan-binding protein n=1 Tax=Scytonema hofmannii PCC 7110 TaxID=128403 RepID=A0A139WUH4_9CYAN|nr:LysM peptidoglycan-binding domain-containing protein [Scytonema hofmannii]KYC36098.1 peptidoglycan-binding protein [Scytonema hofmannii PCC 7110]
MALEKAFIKILTGSRKDEIINVSFNPTEYSLEVSNQFQRTAIPGTSTPVTQFVSGNTETLTMDLFFDSYETKENVRTYTDKITKLLDIDPALHAPPICEFHWSPALQFKATVEQVTHKFTLFLESGIPVRATLSVTFKEYRTLSEQIIDVKKESRDRTKRITVKQSDRLWHIADQEYEEPGLWRPIATANKISNPRILAVGTELVVPVLK